MKILILVLAISCPLFFSLDLATAQVIQKTVRDDFIDNFEEKNQGEYTLNPSDSCQPVRKATKVRVEIVTNGPQKNIRVIYLDKDGKQVGSKLYPVDKSRIATVNSNEGQPNSLLWETNITDAWLKSPIETRYERMTFNEHALSFDVLKKRDPVGMFSFFKPRETVAETRCNFTRSEFMRAPPETPPRREDSRTRRPTRS